MCAHNDLYAEEVDDDWRKALRLISYDNCLSFYAKNKRFPHESELESAADNVGATLSIGNYGISSARREFLRNKDDYKK